jgi:hypothetical protein
MDDWTHNPLILKNHAPEQMFCAPQLANSYQIDGHSYSAIGVPRSVAADRDR